MYVCAAHICSAHGSQVSDPQELVTAVSTCECWKLNIVTMKEEQVLLIH